jgi:hypothetical protein
MALIGRNIHVVLLDDDDAFKEGARDVFDLYCSSRAVVKCSNNDVSGCVMHLATFYTLLKRYILTDDPTCHVTRRRHRRYGHGRCRQKTI